MYFHTSIISKNNYYYIIKQILLVNCKLVQHVVKLIGILF